MIFNNKKNIRVVSVINPYKVAINAGEKDGISIGDTILFYYVGDEITDPETSENLGALEIVRGKGRVTHVQDRLSTVESIRLERKAKPARDYMHLLVSPFPKSNSDDAEKFISYDGIMVGDIGRKV